MNYVKETIQMLKTSPSAFADLVGLSYTKMSDILEGKEQPTDKLIRGCETARKIFLDKNDTQRVNLSQ